MKTIKQANNKEETIQLAKEIYEEIKARDEEHWKKLNTYGYSEYPETENSDCWGIRIGDMNLSSHHEANEPAAIMRFIKKFFELEK